MAQCKFRSSEKECKVPDAYNVAFCGRCLQGQIADEIALNTNAIMLMSMNELEEEAND
jgi:hypothetical protein